MYRPLPTGPMVVRIEYRMAGAIGVFEQTSRTVQISPGMTWEDVSREVRREFPYDRYDHVHLMPPLTGGSPWGVPKIGDKIEVDYSDDTSPPAWVTGVVERLEEEHTPPGIPGPRINTRIYFRVTSTPDWWAPATRALHLGTLHQTSTRHGRYTLVEGAS